ncbi:PAS domain-containing protein [Botryobacter ruber]|uniref:PAS domain-containing protein n=1 Tax=Botryobacter ruber TaxID=2171629 RepID=UPI000E0B0146|nr:PAS domain-containing protein [Botryobacter ruber]
MNNIANFDPGTLMNPLIAARLRLFSRVASLVVVVAGVLVLLGWLFNMEGLKRINDDFVAMNPLTAICFILSGTGLWLLQEPVRKKLPARVLAGTVTFFGFLKLLTVLLKFYFPLDQVLFSDKLFEEALGIPNVMAPNTAFSFMLAGLALLLIDVEFGYRKRPAQFICILITLLAILSIYGYIYGVDYLIGFAAYIPMAVNTAIAFLILAVGILFARPDKGSMGVIFSSEETGEALFSRLFAIVFPLMLGWLKLKGEKIGYFNSEFGTALFAISTYAFSMFLLGRNAVMKYRVRKQRLKTLHLLQDDAKKLQSILDNASSLVYIKDLSGAYEQVNRQFETVFKLKSNQVKGKTEYDIFSKDIAKEIYENDREVLDTGATKYLEEVFMLEDEERTYLTVKFPLKDLEGDLYGLCSISTDITERKKMEELLRENEQRLNAILAGMGEAVVVVDNTGKFIFFNDIAEEVLGLGLTDTPVAEWSSRYGSFMPDGKTEFPPEELPLFRGLKGESTDDVEIFVRNANIPDGRSIKVTGRPIYNDTNEIIASVVVARDITHEKHLEHLIHENEQRLHTVIATMGEGVVVADKRGRFVLFNKKAEEILGMGLEEMSAAEWSKRYRIFKLDGKTLYPAEELPLAKALRGEATDDVELCIKNSKFPHGKLISVSGRPIFDDEGKVAAGVVDFRDVSDIRHMEHALEQIKEKYQFLINRRRRFKEIK